MEDFEKTAGTAKANGGILSVDPKAAHMAMTA